jgi:guanylate kinase
METIEEQIKNYKPNQAGAELLGATEVVLLVGITGAGKDTVLREMLKSGTFHNLITTVTRPPRYNNGVLEQDGVEYHFINDEAAVKLLEAGEYVEASLVHGRIYGVTAEEIRRAHDKNMVALADVDVQGVAKYKKVSDNVTAIFLVPPSYAEWRRRVRNRYPTEEEFLEDWPNRRRSAVVELERALATPYYHFVINDELSETVHACMQIAHRRDEFVRKDDEVRLRTRDLLDALLEEINREEQ